MSTNFEAVLRMNQNLVTLHGLLNLSDNDFRNGHGGYPLL